MSPERLCPLLLLLGTLPAWGRGAPGPPDSAEHAFSFDLRAGAGVDTNALRDPQASTQTALLRLDLASELEATRHLRIDFSGWYEQHLPVYDLNEVNLDLLLRYRRPVARRLTLVLGSLSGFRRQLSNFVAGTVYTHGGTLVTEYDEQASAGLDLQMGQFDLEVSALGHVKRVEALDPFHLYGVGASAALRFVPNGYLSIRARYLFLFEDIIDLLLLDATGQPTGLQHPLSVRTHQGDLSLRVRPIEAVNLYARYDFAFVADNYLGYLFGYEHRVTAGVRLEPSRRWVIDLAGKVVSRSYPLRRSSPDNQGADLQYEAVADVELWLHKSWGLFVRYDFSGEEANPFGQLYLRHAAVLGLAARSVTQW